MPAPAYSEFYYPLNVFMHILTHEEGAARLDEFTVRAEDGASLHALDRVLAAAKANGFELVEDLDVSAKAAPTIDYFSQRFPRYRDALKSELALTDAQIDSLIDNGVRYRDFYDRGVYAYRVMQFRR